jgi:hypothetical protein
MRLRTPTTLQRWARVDDDDVGNVRLGPAQVSDVREQPASRSAEAQGTYTTPPVAFVATKAGGGYGGGGQKLNPDPLADGAPHTTFRTDPAAGEVTHYTSWEPNLQNPSGYDPVKRFDEVGGSHYNKVTGERVPTPHIRGPGISGGIRPADPWEIPGNG